MTHVLPGLEQYDKLLPVTRELYQHTNSLSWQMLLPLFLLSVAIGYTSDLGISGAVVIRLKRLFIVALLLISFPTIVEFAQIIGIEIAKSIDNMTGIDQVLDAASKRANMYSFDLQGLLNLGSDLIMGSLVLISFLILVFARYLLLAFQHFYWLLLVVLGPFMILCSLFEASAGITKSLFKNLFLVSTWPVIWSILSAFLKSIPFASAYETEGGLITIITLNLIIAIALLFSPFIVSQLCEGVNLSVGDTLRRGALKAVSYVSPKGLAMQGFGKSQNFSKKFTRKVKNQIN